MCLISEPTIRARPRIPLRRCVGDGDTGLSPLTRDLMAADSPEEEEGKSAA